MPIYAYRCASCGHAKDVLQKLSDAPLTACPACGAQTFAKQLTAAGFQLKGSGWYVTDFRGGNSGGKDGKGEQEGQGGKDDKGAPQADGKADAKPDAKTAKTETAAPAGDAPKKAATSAGAAGAAGAASPPARSG